MRDETPSKIVGTKVVFVVVLARRDQWWRQANVDRVAGSRILENTRKPVRFPAASRW